MDEKNDGPPRPEDVLIEALLEANGRAAGAVYEFGSFKLEIREQRLLKEGGAVSLAPKEFETLRLLVERHGRLVTKQELLDRVWAGTFVGDDTIAQRISCLRKALGGDADSTKYIETVPKRGYRFVATVSVS
jgi:DNA-binding winged helix-turn-helix (wHTH) protein